MTNMLHFATSLEKGTGLKSEVTAARAEFSHGLALPYSLDRIMNRTGVERSPSALGRFTWNLHSPPMSSDLSKQTGSKSSSRQLLMQESPLAPDPITAILFLVMVLHPLAQRHLS